MTKQRSPMAIEDRDHHRPTRMKAYTVPKARWIHIVREIVFWLRPFLHYFTSRFYGRYVLKVTPHERGIRSAEIIAKLGARGALLAQLASRRIDLLPLEVCLALRRIQDARPPVDPEFALKRMEELAGKPRDEVIAQIDSTPLGSNSLYCAWHATLKDGREVVIKMRRPGVDERLAATLAVLNVLWRVAEILTLVPSGVARRLRADFRKAFCDDLDLRWQGQLQLAFRRQVKVDKLRFVNAAKVLPEFLDHDIIVTRYERTVPLTAILRAVANNDAHALAKLAERGIKPRKVARRLLYLHWWTVFEGIFFLPDPNPKSIVVTDDSKLILTSMSSGEVIPSQKRLMLRRVLERLQNDDVSRAGFAMLHVLSPLPNLDVYDISKKLETHLTTAHYRTRNEGSPWADRTLLGIWKSLLDTAQHYRIPIRQPIVRVIRSEMNYSMLAGMIWRELDIWNAFSRYRSKSYRRIIRRERKRLKREAQAGPEATFAKGYQDVILQIDDLSAFAETIVKKTPVEMNAMANKGSYSAMILGRTLLFMGAVTSGLVALRALMLGVSDPHWSSIGPIFAEICAHPVYLVSVWLITLWTTRVVLARINDVDTA